MAGFITKRLKYGDGQKLSSYATILLWNTVISQCWRSSFPAARALKDYKTFRDLADGEFLEDFTLGQRACVAAALDEFEAAGTGISEEAMAWRNPFVESQRKILLRKLSGIGEVEDAGGDDTLRQMQANKGQTKRDRKFLAFMSRLTMSLFGGFALTVPMLIMDLYPTKLTTCWRPRSLLSL
jgi:hypothetical protein